MHCLAFGLDAVQQKRADDVSCVALEINVTLTLLIRNYFGVPIRSDPFVHKTIYLIAYNTHEVYFS